MVIFMVLIRMLMPNRIYEELLMNVRDVMSDSHLFVAISGI